jgi:archaeal cell division control protein 6
VSILTNSFNDLLVSQTGSTRQCLILDEIDLLVGRRANDEPAYSKLLYQLSRASNTNEIQGRVSVAALTNDPKFMENIDGRAESSFNPRDIYFPDYDATQLREILNNRRDAFRQDSLTDDVIPLVAAFAAQSHGDARKAIDLFRGAGDLADEWGDREVTEIHVRESQEEIDKDRSLKLVEGLTTQKKRYRCTQPPLSLVIRLEQEAPSQVRLGSKSINGLLTNLMPTK